MSRFRDASGSYGPAGWHGGEFPLGEEDFPVSGVSWFEAMAYARFAEKSLPTVHHWKWAGRSGNSGITTALSNFSDRGPTPRGVQEGIGVFEVYDMAGNVKEWCFNEDAEGRRYLKGGAWNEAEYRFNFDELASPWDRSFTNGFRCVRYVGESAPEALTLQPVERPDLKHANIERESIESLRKWYQFDRSDLDVEQLPSDVEASGEYRHEVVRVDAAYEDEQLEIHLFLPRKRQKQCETVVYVPGLGQWNSGGEFSPQSFHDWKYVADLPASGRIVCQPIYKGTFFRWRGRKVGEQFAESPLAARDDFIAVSKEVSRAVDYLLTRPDVDPNRLVYFGQSLGAMRGPATLVAEPRFAAAVLLAGGYTHHFERLSEIDSYQFTPHVTTPVLMINGTNESGQPYESSQRPFFEDLGSEVKDHVLLPSGHNPPAEDVFREMDKWLKQLFVRDTPRPKVAQ